MKITFVTKIVSTPFEAFQIFENKAVACIDANQLEQEIVKEVRKALQSAVDNNCEEIQIQSWSLIAFTAVRLWCKENKKEAVVLDYTAEGTSVFEIYTTGKIKNGNFLFPTYISLIYKLA